MSNLALDLRPREIDQLVGQDALKKAVKSFAEKDNWPNVFLLYGPPGTGKTTSAEIIARLVQPEDTYVHNINGSAENKVEDARIWEEQAWSIPFNGRRRVFILNEFQMLTPNAQQALKDPMEKTPALWVITTDSPEKISDAIKSRASAATFQLRPLKKEEIWHLINKATNKIDPTATTMDLLKNGITSPREILGVVDQLLAGVPFEQAVHGAEHEPLYKDVCGAVLKGNWPKASELLAQIKTADSRGLISVLSAFFRSELVKCPIGPRADALAVCLVGMDQTGFADGVAYGAVTGLLYKCCKALGAK
jgi:DNA polymerase III gamma/tau subunit